MARRYHVVHLVHLNCAHRLAPDQWREYVQRGWLTPAKENGQPSTHTAIPTPGMIAQIKADGTIAFLDLRHTLAYSIPSSWRWIERMMLFSKDGRFLGHEVLQKEIQRLYGAPETRARDIERHLNSTT